MNLWLLQSLETWKRYKDSSYLVSQSGKVFSCRRNIILSPALQGKGYLMVQIFLGGVMYKKLVHRLVAETWIPKCDLPEVNHRNEDKTNNWVHNLEWCTTAYNANYGTRNRRIGHSRCKPVFQFSLDGKFIRKFESVTEAARILNLDRSAINNCAIGRYKHSNGFIWRR